jgi:hypothetical protein
VKAFKIKLGFENVWQSARRNIKWVNRACIHTASRTEIIDVNVESASNTNHGEDMGSGRYNVRRATDKRFCSFFQIMNEGEEEFLGRLLLTQCEPHGLLGVCSDLNNELCLMLKR